jgi:hypothetical protein
LRRDRPQASRSRHCRAGRPILSPLIPGCSVAGDQGPSRSPIRGPMSRRCPECELAAPRQRPSAPRPGEDGFWRQMAARPPRAARRAASAPSGAPAGRGEWRSPCSDPLVWACSSAEMSALHARIFIRCLVCRYPNRAIVKSIVPIVSEDTCRLFAAAGRAGMPAGRMQIIQFGKPTRSCELHVLSITPLACGGAPATGGGFSCARALVPGRGGAGPGSGCRACGIPCSGGSRRCPC